MAEQVLDQFLGSPEFPIEWNSEQEQQLLWVFDDLHCPHPLRPMFYDIGGWWLTCDHMFRRFGTPFACDWITKNVNGYLYTAAVPADPAGTGGEAVTSSAPTVMHAEDGFEWGAAALGGGAGFALALLSLGTIRVTAR